MFPHTISIFFSSKEYFSQFNIKKYNYLNTPTTNSKFFSQEGKNNNIRKPHSLLVFFFFLISTQILIFLHWKLARIPLVDDVSQPHLDEHAPSNHSLWKTNSILFPPHFPCLGEKFSFSLQRLIIYNNFFSF